MDKKYGSANILSTFLSKLRAMRQAKHTRLFLKNLVGFTRKKYREAVPFIKELMRNYLYEKVYTIKTIEEDDEFEVPEGAKLEHRKFKLHCPGRLYELDSELVKRIEHKVIVCNYQDCHGTECDGNNPSKYKDIVVFGTKAIIVIKLGSFYYLVLTKSCHMKLNDLFEEETVDLLKKNSAKEFDHFEVVLAS